jgi:undecaprenyl-diphosphatase
LNRPSRIAVGAFTVAAVTIFALLAVALMREQLERLDTRGAAMVDGIRSAFADVFFASITWAGSSFLLVPLCLAIAWWFRAHGRTLVGPVLMAPAAAILLQNVLKPLFDRTRPEAGVLAQLGPSFPSGHSMASAAVWLSLAYVMGREQLLPKPLVIIAPTIPLLVGVSRVYLGVHWTSDVIAGWCTGLMIVVCSIVLYERARDIEESGVAGST